MEPQPPSRAALTLSLIKGGLVLVGLVLLVVIVRAVAGGDEEDAAAQLACSDFRRTLAELPLPSSMLEGRIEGIYERARSATTPGVAYGAHVLLITGDMTRLADACAKVPPL